MTAWLALILIVLGAIAALEARELMRAVLGLAVFFLGVSVLFGLLGAWFFAVGQIFLFVGGVVTLFVLAFSSTDAARQSSLSLSPLLASLAVGGLLLWLSSGLGSAPPIPLQVFSTVFFTKYGLALNTALLLLFSAVMTAQYVMSEDQE